MSKTVKKTTSKPTFSSNNTLSNCDKISSSQFGIEDLEVLKLICQIKEQESIDEGCIDKNDPIGLEYRGGMSRTRHGKPLSQL